MSSGVDGSPQGVKAMLATVLTRHGVDRSMSQPVQDVQMHVDRGLEKQSLRRRLICRPGAEAIQTICGSLFGKCTPEIPREDELEVDQRR